MINLWNAIDDVRPTILETVSIMNRQIKKLSDAVDVLLFQLFVGIYLSKFVQGRDKSISDIVDFKVATDSNCVHKSLQA